MDDASARLQHRHGHVRLRIYNANVGARLGERIIDVFVSAVVEESHIG